MTSLVDCNWIIRLKYISDVDYHDYYDWVIVVAYRQYCLSIQDNKLQTTHN